MNMLLTDEEIKFVKEPLKNERGEFIVRPRPTLTEEQIRRTTIVLLKETNHDFYLFQNRKDAIAYMKIEQNTPAKNQFILTDHNTFKLTPAALVVASRAYTIVTGTIFRRFFSHSSSWKLDKLEERLCEFFSIYSQENSEGA